MARIPLPPHDPEGEFDHAAVDPPSDRLYVAHPSNDAVEVVDLRERAHLRSLKELRGIAGVWVDPASRLLFTSNRGEDTASIFRIEDGGERELFRVPTGARPNGMAFDRRRQLLLVAGVGNAAVPTAPPSLTFVDATHGTVVGTLRAPGRTRWALYHEAADRFFVNVADPPEVVAVAAGDPTRIAAQFAIPAKGPHGLEQDPGSRALYCACDEGVLFRLDPTRGEPVRIGTLSGSPDVVWLNRQSGHLFVAIGEPGVVDRFTMGSASPSVRIPTALGAHTLTVDPARSELHVFLPESHEDLVLADEPD